MSHNLLYAMNHEGTEDTEKGNFMATKRHKNASAGEALKAPIGARWILADVSKPFLRLFVAKPALALFVPSVSLWLK